eukprot:COSAG05_NODE_12_length_37297_cov_117.537072_34_plen_74_part_00
MNDIYQDFMCAHYVLSGNAPVQRPAENKPGSSAQDQLSPSVLVRHPGLQNQAAVTAAQGALTSVGFNHTLVGE